MYVVKIMEIMSEIHISYNIYPRHFMVLEEHVVSWEDIRL